MGKNMISERIEMRLPDNYDIYCFDYYDTIVFRTVEPEYVKKIWCKELKEFFPINQNVSELYKIRNKIEAELCDENQRNGCDLEFQYASLTDRIYSFLCLENAVSKEEFTQIATNIELSIESRIQRTYNDIVEEIQRLKRLGKTIICISDFYTDAKFLKKLLVFHQISELFDHVFVSSDELLTKRSGRLYDEVVKKMRCSPDRMLMVGDNRLSDYEMPLQKGMGAVYVNRDRQKEAYHIFLAKHEKENYVEKSLTEIYNICNRDKYEDLSFSLYYFIAKLYNKLRRERIQNVFFLSREGEFLKKLFDLYQASRVKYGIVPIQSHYLMVSRKSTFIASLKPIDEENFEMIFRQYVNISLYDFLASLGFDDKEQIEIGKRLNVDIYKKQEDLPHTNLYASLIQDEYFRNKYECLRRTQKQYFNDYLNSFCVDFEKDGMYLVDVGWKGTIQDNIFMFFDQKYEITGLYLGLVAPGKVHPNNKKEGLLFTCIPDLSEDFFIYDENKSIFEVMLGASHGSADHYEEKDQNIIVVTAEKKEERELFQNLILPMQNGIFARFKEIDEILVNHSFDFEKLEKIVNLIHAKLTFLPTKEQINLFYQIYHYENFGIFEFTKFKTSDAIGFKERMQNLKRMFREKRAFFQSSFWGVIALKNAGLGLLIRPYGWYMFNKYCRQK